MLKRSSSPSVSDDISIGRALMPPAILLLAMLAAAALVSAYTGVNGSSVFWPYLSGWMAATLLSVLLWMAVETSAMAMRREPDPIRQLSAKLARKYPLLVLPALIFPLFLAGYTWAKVSIPFLVGYPWEAFWADLDRALLRDDGWRLAHAVMPAYFAQAWTIFYAAVWGFALVFIGALLTVFAKRRTVANFYTALMLSWFVGGFLLAYALSAAGPVFAHLADSNLADRFSPLRSELLGLLGSDDIVLRTQHYLALGIDRKIALKGGGISAMPSMHIATVTVMLLAAWKSRWRALALLFWVMTFFGSVYLGYHYAIDAPVAAAVAVACWGVASRMFGSIDKTVPNQGIRRPGDDIPVRIG